MARHGGLGRWQPATVNEVAHALLAERALIMQERIALLPVGGQMSASTTRADSPFCSAARIMTDTMPAVQNRTIPRAVSSTSRKAMATGQAAMSALGPNDDAPSIWPSTRPVGLAKAGEDAGSIECAENGS